MGLRRRWHVACSREPGRFKTASYACLVRMLTISWERPGAALPSCTLERDPEFEVLRNQEGVHGRRLFRAGLPESDCKAKEDGNKNESGRILCGLQQAVGR